MKFADLSAATRQKIERVKWDGIFEKHEGPYDWNWIFKTLEEGEEIEFLTIDDCSVLLPIYPEHYTNVEILRTIWSADRNSVTIFLLDTTYHEVSVRVSVPEAIESVISLYVKRWRKKNSGWQLSIMNGLLSHQIQFLNLVIKTLDFIIIRE
jgi:hypothetical protein